jgi:hypothetical protein
MISIPKYMNSWLPLSLIFGMGTLKISYIWSCRGLLPGPLCLLLYLTQHTVLQELEGSLQLPEYHRHIHRFVLIFQDRVALFQVFQGFVKNEVEQCCRQTISLPNLLLHQFLFIFFSTFRLSNCFSVSVFPILHFSILRHAIKYNYETDTTT